MSERAPLVMSQPFYSDLAFSAFTPVKGCHSYVGHRMAKENIFGNTQTGLRTALFPLITRKPKKKNTVLNNNVRRNRNVNNPKIFGPRNANVLLILPHKILGGPRAKAEYPHGWVVHEEVSGAPGTSDTQPDRTPPIIGSVDWNRIQGVPRALTRFYNFSRVA